MPDSFTFLLMCSTLILDNQHLSFLHRACSRSCCLLNSSGPIYLVFFLKSSLCSFAPDKTSHNYFVHFFDIFRFCCILIRFEMTTFWPWISYFKPLGLLPPSRFPVSFKPLLLFLLFNITHNKVMVCHGFSFQCFPWFFLLVFLLRNQLLKGYQQRLKSTFCW